MSGTVSVSTISDLFREEVRDLGGTVCDEASDDRRLYARAVLPEADDVVAGDRVRAGIAVRCSVTGDIEVRPYVFRDVCSNGAIASHSDVGRRIETSGRDGASCLVEVRAAVRDAARPWVFRGLLLEMRRARQVPIDSALDLVAGLIAGSGLEAGILLDLLELVMRERDAYGVGNAITARARDTADPGSRWRLESLGAAVFASRPAPLRGSRSKVSRRAVPSTA